MTVTLLCSSAVQVIRFFRKRRAAPVSYLPDISRSSGIMSVNDRLHLPITISFIVKGANCSRFSRGQSCCEGSMALGAFYGTIASHKSCRENALFTNPISGGWCGHCAVVPAIGAPTACIISAHFKKKKNEED